MRTNTTSSPSAAAAATGIKNANATSPASRFDCALFDVDGVLVDIRKSYNEAIKKTVDFVLARSDAKKIQGLVTNDIILQFRQTGGFNNDTDTSYAIALSVLAGGKTNNIADARKFLSEVAKNADETGIESVEKFISSKFDGSNMRAVKEMMVYPAPVKESFIGRVFDELFYGPVLFEKQNGIEPRYYHDHRKDERQRRNNTAAGTREASRPFIDNDKLVVSKKTMKILNEKFDGNLAIVSGRSRLAAEYSLKPIMQYFDIDACVFLEDEKREYAKPNPYAAKKAMKTMGAKNAVYCGDSAEDMLMARRAQKETGLPIAFVGIYGFSPEPAKSLAIFKEKGAEATARNVDLLPQKLAKL